MVSGNQQQRYYGKYRGFVVDRADPENLCRLKLRVPSVLSDQVTNWALPCLPFGGTSDVGLVTVPEVGAQVWVEFEEGLISNPIWVGTFWQASATVPENDQEEPFRRTLKTPSGHSLVFDDEADQEQIRLEHNSGSKVTIAPNGTIQIEDTSPNTITLDTENGMIQITDANGNQLVMDSSGSKVEDSNGNTIEMTASGITLAGQKVVIDAPMVCLGGEGGEPVIKGQNFLTLFATHTHPTGVGPSGPPIPQGEMSTLSVKVTTS